MNTYVLMMIIMIVSGSGYPSGMPTISTVHQEFKSYTSCTKANSKISKEFYSQYLKTSKYAKKSDVKIMSMCVQK